MELNQIYVVNPQYFLKTDINRIIFCNRSLKKTKPQNISDDYIAFIHPLQAIMLSYFDGKMNLGQIIDRISGDFHLSNSKTQNLLVKYVENPQEFCISDGKNDFYFPKKVLIKSERAGKYFTYNPKDFCLSAPDLDFSTSRLNKPLDILLITNMNCYTNCIYCYADRKHEYKPLALSKIYDIIDEAKSLRLREFDVNGGEFLLYPHWDKILERMYICGYSPFISTKVPLSASTIKKLNYLGIDSLQISLDSVIADELSSLLKVKSDYKTNIINSLKELDKQNIDIYTNSIITRYNDSHKGIIMLLNFLTSLKNIKQINLSAAGYSMYIAKNEYNKLKSKEEDLKRINGLVNEYALKNPGIEINFGSYITNEEINGDRAIKKELFNARSFCTANNTGLIILPDGQVTICEELYWNKHFIVGDINNSGIIDLWNSERAIELFKFNQSKMSNETYCRECSEIEECTKKTRCWKMVLMAYGQEKWDNPDPRCPYAPVVENEIYHT